MAEIGRFGNTLSVKNAATMCILSLVMTYFGTRHKYQLAIVR